MDNHTSTSNPDWYKDFGYNFGITMAIVPFIFVPILFVFGCRHRSKWEKGKVDLSRIDHKSCRLKNIRLYRPPIVSWQEGAPKPKTTGGKPMSLDDSSYHPPLMADVLIVTPSGTFKNWCGLDTKP